MFISSKVLNVSLQFAKGQARLRLVFFVGWVASGLRAGGGVFGLFGSTGPRALNLKTALSLPGICSLDTAWAQTSCPVEVFTCLISGFEPPGAQEGIEEFDEDGAELGMETGFCMVTGFSC